MNIYWVTAFLLVAGFLAKKISVSIKSRRDKSLKKRIARLASAAVFEKISDFAFLAAKVYVVIICIVLILQLIGIGLTSNSLSRIQAVFAYAEQNLKTFSEFAGVVILSISFLALLVILYRREKRDASQVAKRQYDDLIGQYKDGTLPQLEPTKEMNEIRTKISGIYDWIYEQEQKLHELPKEDVQAQVKPAFEAISEFQGLYIQIDIERRINLWETQNEKKTFKGRLLYFIT